MKPKDVYQLRFCSYKAISIPIKLSFLANTEKLAVSYVIRR